MKSPGLAAKISSIEAQLEILKLSDKEGALQKGRKGLRSLKGFLKGKRNFSEADFEKAKIRYRGNL